MKKSIVGLKELRENIGTYIKAVEKGESFIVVKRSRPIFKMSAVDDNSAWEEVVDFTKIKKGGVDIKEVLARL
jgi:prevent-host-death family protein